MRIILLTSMALLLLAGCSNESSEQRARETAERIKESIPDVEARALEQKVTPEQVKRAQAALTAAHEYLGEVSGKLDAVTVNAVEAFQLAHGLAGDGILNEKTERLLQEQLAKKE